MNDRQSFKNNLTKVPDRNQSGRAGWPGENAQNNLLGAAPTRKMEIVILRQELQYREEKTRMN